MHDKGITCWTILKLWALQNVEMKDYDIKSPWIEEGGSKKRIKNEFIE